MLLCCDIVAALISPSGPPGRLLDAIIEGEYIQHALDDRIEAEYRTVLMRKKFKFELPQVHALLAELAFQKKGVTSIFW